MYRALRALNTDLEASDVLEMARENIERKWAVIETERRVEEERQAAADAQSRNSERQIEALQQVQGYLEGGEDTHFSVRIRQEGRIRAIDITPYWARQHIRVIRRLEAWMKAAEGRSVDGTDLWRITNADVARLLGCVTLTVENWLSGHTRQPQQLHIVHLHAMMENYTYAQIRAMLVSGERVVCD